MEISCCLNFANLYKKQNLQYCTYSEFPSSWLVHQTGVSCGWCPCIWDFSLRTGPGGPCTTPWPLPPAVMSASRPSLEHWGWPERPLLRRRPRPHRVLVPGVSSPVFSQEARTGGSTAWLSFLLGQHACSNPTIVKNSVYRWMIHADEGPLSPVTGCSDPPTRQGIRNQRRGPAGTSWWKNSIMLGAMRRGQRLNRNCGERSRTPIFYTRASCQMCLA